MNAIGQRVLAALRTSHFALRTPRALATRYRGTWWQILGKVENVVDVVDAADVGVGGRPHRCWSGITSRGGSLWGYYHHSATLHLAQPRLPAQLSLDYQPSSAQNTSPALPRLPAQSLGSAKWDQRGPADRCLYLPPLLLPPPPHPH